MIISLQNIAICLSSYQGVVLQAVQDRHPQSLQRQTSTPIEAYMLC